MAEVLGAFSLATDLGMAQSMGHVLRACYIALRIGLELKLADSDQAILYYSTLLMHSGCPASSSLMAALVRTDEMDTTRAVNRHAYSNPLEEIEALARHVEPDAPLPLRLRYIVQALANAPRSKRESQIGTCEVGALMARRLGMPEGVEQTLLYLFEHWDGTGYHHLRGEQIPLCARIVDPASMLEVHHELAGRAGMEQVVRAQRGKVLAPDIADAFLALTRDERFWQELSSDDLPKRVLDMEPENPCQYIGPERLDEVVLAFAHFADAKSVATLGHAEGTADVAEAIAQQMGLPAGEVITIRRAGLLHDLGLVAVGVPLIEKRGALTQAEQEKMRLHPYYSERILSTVPGLQTVAPIAGGHHEWLNGKGYYRGLSGEALPLGARILAVADAFQELTEEFQGHPAREPLEAFQALAPKVGTEFAPECYEALSQALGVDHALPKSPVRRVLPAGLTEREVQVLQLVARGWTNKQVAAHLVLSEKTVGHHIEHIYNKIGVSTRAAAVFYALEHNLV
jgi:HD-GYP domain-containing protein (c-di-GMP phosphodiesterase class II)/DNA-binding CsgD family transcriptional regulator